MGRYGEAAGGEGDEIEIEELGGSRLKAQGSRLKAQGSRLKA